MSTSLYSTVLGYDPISKSNRHTVPFEDYLDDKVKWMMFILSEYIKRKFYLDCNIKQENGHYIFQKNNSRTYQQINIDDQIELMKYISNIIGGTISQKFNEEIFRDKYLFKYKGKCEPLSLLHYLYMKGYLEFKRILMEHIAKCNEKIRIISFNYLYNHKYDYYTYERIIYALSKIYIDQSYLKKTLNDFGIMVAYISEHFDYKENIFLLMLFNHFINKYSLFFCEIINPADIGPYIFSSKTIERLPVFFQLPKIPAIPFLIGISTLNLNLPIQNLIFL